MFQLYSNDIDVWNHRSVEAHAELDTFVTLARVKCDKYVIRHQVYCYIKR